MTWGDYVRSAEGILNAPGVPSSLEIISLIKKVNPTRLTLAESDRELGYRLKAQLQSLLLEQYGESFCLVPHSASPNIILIKHRFLPSIDACHAESASLSLQALNSVDTAAPLPLEKEPSKRGRNKGRRQKKSPVLPKEVLKKAQALLEEYDYGAVEEVLGDLHAVGSGDVPVLARAGDILLHEIGAYQRCIDTLVSQPKDVLKNRGIRELLAVAYHHNGSVPEARAILDELHPAELGPEALRAYADISFKDGNLSAAFELIKMAKGKGPFSPGLDSLQQDIEAAMAAQADPLLETARTALVSADYEAARRLAREALDIYPNCQAAREVVATVDGIEYQAQLAELWGRLERVESGDRRLALLSRLLERDKEQSERIKVLIDEEKERQRRVLFGEQLESLKSLVLAGRWPECFDALVLLSKQPEFRERAAEIRSLSPMFSVLFENKRVHGSFDRSVKEPWLSFVKVKTSVAAGNAEGCFEILEKLKPWFSSYPEFEEDYQALLQAEQETARKEIAALVERSQAECRVMEVRSIFGCIRKRMSVLPLAERRELVQTMEQRLAQLTPEQDPGKLLEEYREALQIGNSEKVAYLRQEIADLAAIEAIDSEHARAFHIASEPLSLEISDDLPIDLTTEPSLNIYFVAGDRFFLRDSEDALVMIDFSKKAASRMTSPVFAQTGHFDYIGNDVFLFIEGRGQEYGDKVWRAELSVEGAAFTAHFNMKEWFELEEGVSIDGVLLSSERDTDYYVCIKHDEGRVPAKVMKKRLAPKATIESFEGKKPRLQMWRWTSCPDRFIVGCEGRLRHLNRNLSLTAALDVTPDLYKIDGREGHVYGMESCFLTKRGFRLELIKSFDTATSLGVFEAGRVHGISLETETALVVLGDGRQSFYHLGSNKFSSKIRVGRVIPHDGRWYSFDYDRKQGKLRLRDITHDIQSMLEWREFMSRQDQRKKMLKRMMWFNDHDNFVFKPEEWEAR